MIVDAHVHIFDLGEWPASYYDHIAYSWGYAKPPYRDPAAVRPKIEPGLADADGDRMVADMGVAGIDVAVLLPMDWGPDYDEPDNPGRVSVRAMQERAARIASKHQGRIVAFAGIDPRRPEAMEVLEWAVDQLGLAGLKLYPPMGFYPYDRVAFPLYDFCQARGVPILFHTGRGSLPFTRPRFADPIYLYDVQLAFPRLTIWLGHAGGPRAWDEAVTVASHGVHSHLELSSWIWDNTDEAAQEAFLRKLARARDQLGPHRLLFGSDHVSGQRIRGRAFLPHVTGWFRELPERARRLGLSFSEEDMELMMGGAAAEQLRLKAKMAVADYTGGSSSAGANGP